MTHRNRMNLRNYRIIIQTWCLLLDLPQAVNSQYLENFLLVEIQVPGNSQVL
jgi:hypothetical protein